MGFGKADFQKTFLKNFFKEILKEEKQFETTHLDDVCELLANLYVKEFENTYPYAIISEHGSVENWLRKKIDDMGNDKQRL